MDELAQAAVFIAVAWVLGQIGRYFNSQLVGEIVAGILLSSDVIGWVPYQDAILLLGRVGLVLLVAEGGLSVQLDLLPKIGLRAVTIAVLGTVRRPVNANGCSVKCEWCRRFLWDWGGLSCA